VLSASDRKNNWLVYGGNFESQHFSPLNAISDKNIGNLGLAWSTDIDSPMGLALEPIVVDGVIYLGLPLDVVEAFDGGAERFDDEMIERMHFEAAQRVLARAGR